jgi:HEAT repeat protein
VAGVSEARRDARIEDVDPIPGSQSVVGAQPPNEWSAITALTGQVDSSARQPCIGEVAMAVTMQQVRSALDVEEPDYPAAAALGPEALPHLEKLVKEADSHLASKATYLSGLIAGPGSVNVLMAAAQRGDPVIRVAAAAAIRHLPSNQVADVLVFLLDDADASVRRLALDAVRADASAELRSRVERMARTAADPVTRNASREALARIARQ